MNLKTAIAIGGSANTMLRHALCVFPVLPSLMHNENPLVVPPLLGGKKKEEKKIKKRKKKKKKNKKKKEKNKNWKNVHSTKTVKKVRPNQNPY